MASKRKAKHPRRRRLPSKQAINKAADLFDNVHKTKVRVVGVGGGGGNIVAEVAGPLQKFDFIGANTDVQALKQLPKKVRTFSFGADFTNGLGCGMDAELGERAAKAEREKIRKLLEGSDITIVVASLGGGTGSGAAATFAEVSQKMRSLTIGIFTMPFSFEGERRTHIAQTALEKIKPFVNAYVLIPNESIFKVIDEKTSLKASLSAVNKRLANTLEGFMDMLVLPGLINIDFADVHSILEGKGRLAYINSVEAVGATKAEQAAQGVLVHPLYEYDMSGADRVLFNVTGDRNLKMQEVAGISQAISERNTKARIIFGVSCTSRFKDRVKVTLFAVGCEPALKKAKEEKKQNGEKPEKKPSGKSKRKVLSKKTKKTLLAKPANNGVSESQEDVHRVRRNALEVKKAADEEMKEIEQKEKEWDIPAFLRNK